MTNKQCTAGTCGEPVAGFSTLCSHHKQAQRRHGHPDQTGITTHDLKPYVKLVEARRAKNKDSNAWALLQERWSAVTRDAAEVMAQWERGVAMVSTEVKAAAQIKSLAESATADAVMHTALAMYLMQEAEPRRFRSDRAFDFQLVRRVRGLTPVNAGTYWDNKERRQRKVYRDLPPKVAEVVGLRLRDAFGLAGKLLADRERDDAQKAKQDTQKLAKAMEALQ